MVKKRNDWEVSAIVWMDACTAIDDPDQGIVPVISLGVVVPDPAHRMVRVVHDISATSGGWPGCHTAIPKRGMVVRRVSLGRLQVPDEFKRYWGEIP